MKEYYEENIEHYSNLAAFWKHGIPLSEQDREQVIKHTDAMVSYYKEELQKELNKGVGVGCEYCGGGCGL